MANTVISSPPPIHQLSIGKAFDGLSPQEKLYAHYMSRAAWHGARIILRQVSPESITIFDFILELYNACSGDWPRLASEVGVTQDDCNAFLNYAATFLSNIGNYYGSGDQKFTPAVSTAVLEKLSSKSSKLKDLYAEIAQPMTTVPPYGLGFPSPQAQSTYYPGEIPITKAEIALVSKALEENAILPENTRIRKVQKAHTCVYEVLVASFPSETPPTEISISESNAVIRILRGDHSQQLKEICECLTEAMNYAENDLQLQFLKQYIASFQSGSLHAYRESQYCWIKDKNPRVENIFGFVEPYRDPYGIRAEFEGLVAISDEEETKTLKTLVDRSSIFIKRLPWVNETSTENNGKGPFEKAQFEPPDFTSIHTLAYCSSIIFPGINLPNYNDIRESAGFKNVIIANRMSAESSTNASTMNPFVDQSEAAAFQKHKYPAYYWWVVLHELLGHGTGRMMMEESDGKFNFDVSSPPINPLTKLPIHSWYKPGQTWTGQFGDLATTVDECRAELVGAYLMDDKELLAIFGFNETSEITAAEITYNTYLQLGTDGLRGLANYSVENEKWGQAHSRAHFATLKCLLNDGNGFMTVDFDETTKSLTVRVDRSRIISDGKPALERMLLHLHMFRVTADVEGCRSYYEELSGVDGQYLAWRDVVLARQQPKWTFVQANTRLDGENVVLQEYEPTPEGVVKSWVERNV